MKQHHRARRFFLTLVAFGSAGLASSAQASVLWYGDPNLSVTQVFYRFDTTGYTSGTDCVDNPNNMPVASTATDATYGKHWTIYKPTDRKRAEFARTEGTVNNLVIANGGEYYFGWRWKLTASPSLNKGLAVFQWKSTGSQDYPFNLSYDGSTLRLVCTGPGYTGTGSITAYQTTIWSQAVAQNSWKSLEFHVKVSDDPAVGFIEFWYNGSKQTLENSNYQKYQVVISSDGKRAYHKTHDGTVYMKWGAYGANACDFATTTHYDEMRVATTYDEARPSNYP